MLYVQTRVRTGKKEMRVIAKPDGGVDVYVGDAPPPNHQDDLYGIARWNFKKDEALTVTATLEIAGYFYGKKNRRPACTNSEVADLGDLLQRHFA